MKNKPVPPDLFRLLLLEILHGDKIFKNEDYSIREADNQA
jgi:hypothetical protein